jgi:hypothetical protein
MDRILAECSRAVYRRMQTKRKELLGHTTAYRPIHSSDWADEPVSHHQVASCSTIARSKERESISCKARPLALVSDSHQRLWTLITLRVVEQAADS